MSTIATTYILTFMQLPRGQLSYMVYMTLTVGQQATRLKSSTIYVLKQLWEWHVSLIYCMVLALYSLQGYYFVEISRALQSSYRLHSKFSPTVQIQPPLISEQNVYLSEDIVGQSAQLKLITIVLLQEHHITPFMPAAGKVLQNIVHTAYNNKATKSGKVMKQDTTAAATSSDSDEDVLDLDQIEGQLL